MIGSRLPSEGRLLADPGGEHSAWVLHAVEKYEQPLTAYALRLLRDTERARDVVQETFIRLCKQDRAAIDDHLCEWLYRVCRTRALDLQRKENRLSPLTDEQTSRWRSNAPAPCEAAEQQESAGRAQKIMEGLPENQQEALRLKFQHNMSYKEIAEVMNISVANVGFIIHTGLKTLRSAMQADLPRRGRGANDKIRSIREADEMSVEARSSSA